MGSNRREMKPDGSITPGRNPYGPTDKEVLVIQAFEKTSTPFWPPKPKELEIAAPIFKVRA